MQEAWKLIAYLRPPTMELGFDVDWDHVDGEGLDGMRDYAHLNDIFVLQNQSIN